jgi:hypothetical protein
MKWTAFLGLLAVVLLWTPPAHAGRSVRLMYEAPAATEGGPAVTVTFEEQREEDKGGKDPTLIANERGSYNIPLAVRSGKQGTGHAADVVPDWLTDVLKSAGYTAARGEAGEGPRLHAILLSMWGDQIVLPGGARHQFMMRIELQAFAAGATEPSWKSVVQAGGGTTTVLLRFDDPVENGFVRAFDEASDTIIQLMAEEGFQAALGEANLEAAQAAAAALGQDGKKKKAAAAGVDAGDLSTSDDGVTLTETDVPDSFKSWNPGTFQWISQPKHKAPVMMIEGFVWTGVGAGLLIAGDQWATSLAQTKANVTLAPAGSTLTSIAHIPLSRPNPQADWIAQAAVSELMFSYGMHIFVPSLGSTIPTMVAGAAGADLQTTKTVMGFASAASFIPTGIAMVNRFGTLFAPQWGLHGANQDRWVHIGTGVFPLAIGIVDIAVGSVSAVIGVLYATNTLTARADEKGLFAPATDGRRGLKNSTAWMIPMVTPTESGMTFGLIGAF